MPIYVTLGNWTDQGTKDFGGAVERANGFRALVEQAGGLATNGHQRIMDLTPTKLHERVSVVLGSKNEVQRVTDYHTADAN